jgi:hypothetical protein
MIHQLDRHKPFVRATKEFKTRRSSGGNPPPLNHSLSTSFSINDCGATRFNVPNLCNRHFICGTFLSRILAMTFVDRGVKIYS